MNGLELLKMLKKSKIIIPVIVLSANIHDNVKTQCNELGVKHFLTKPFV